MIAEPVDVLILFDASVSHRAPDLDDPAEQAEMLVNPVECSANDLLGVVSEFVVDADVGVPGQLGSLGADLLVMP